MKSILALLAIASTAVAGHCPQVFVKSHHANAVVLQQVAVPVVQYQVGGHVQAEAVFAQQIAPLKAEIAALRAQLANGVTTTTVTTQAQQAATASVQGAPAGQFARCTKCHSGASAKGEFRVDVELSCEDRLRAISAMLSDDPAKRMPRGADLPAQELGELIQAFSGAGK
jgi:hypothetical protein